MKRKLSIKLLTTLFSFILSSFVISGCDLFEASMPEFFKEYTENAAIMVVSGLENLPVDKNGYRCIQAENPPCISFDMRNPRHYPLDFEYYFSDSDTVTVSSAFTIQNPGTNQFTIKQDSNDTTKASFTFNKDFLYYVENYKQSNTPVSKDLSGTVKITHRDYGLSYADFNLSFRVDSVPPAPDGACLQRTTDPQIDTDGTGEYVLCFFMPDLTKYTGDNAVHHAMDTRVFYLNNKKYYINGNKFYETADYNELTYQWDFSNETSDFELSSAGSFYPLEPNGFTFDKNKNPSSEYFAVYMKTGKTVAEVGTNTLAYTLKIEDDAGLASSLSISNKAEKLTPPVIDNIASLKTGVPVNDDTLVYNLVISHSGKTVDDNDCGLVNIDYTITETDGNKVFNGSASVSSTGISPVTVKLPRGKYKVTAKAIKPYYISSDVYSPLSSSENILIKGSAVYCVSKNGSKSNTGTYDKPFRTIQQAINKFDDEISNHSYRADSDTCIIRILSDIEPYTVAGSSIEDKFDSNNYALAYFGTGKSYVLEGYGSKYTISAEGNSTNKDRRVIYSDADNLTVKNLTITNGYIGSQNTAGAGAGIYTTGNTVIENCAITNNSIECDSHVAPLMGAGIYASNKIVLINSTVTGNTITSTNGSLIGAGIYYAGNITVKGKNIIQNNKINLNSVLQNSNIRILSGTKLTIDGDISGSKIGVGSAVTPSSASDKTVLTSGYNYGTTNKSLPASIFTSDDGIGITYDDDSNSTTKNEAVLKLNGGGIVVANPATLSIAPDSTTAIPGSAITFKVSDNASGTAVDVTSNYNFTFEVTNNGFAYPNTKANGNKLTFESNCYQANCKVSVTAKNKTTGVQILESFIIKVIKPVSVSTAEQFVAALEDATVEVIKLTDDIVLTQKLEIIKGRSITITADTLKTISSQKNTLNDAIFELHQSGSIPSTLTLKNIKIARAEGEQTAKAAIYISNGCTCTLDSGTVISPNGVKSPIIVSNGTLIMNDGSSITGNTTTYMYDYAGAVNITGNGNFVMNGGIISNNHCERAGDDYAANAIYVASGRFTMNGGKITQNNGNSNLININRSNSTYLYLYGGEINNNTVSKDLIRAVTSTGSAMTIDGCKIHDNTSAKALINAGYISGYNSYDINILSGEIFNNKTTGGVIRQADGAIKLKITMKGGSIHDNASLKDSADDGSEPYRYSGGITYREKVTFDGTGAVNAKIYDNYLYSGTSWSSPGTKTLSNIRFTNSSTTPASFTQGTVEITGGIIYE